MKEQRHTQLLMPESKSQQHLIPPQKPEHRGKPTVVLDLDETLGHFRGLQKHWRPE